MLLLIWATRCRVSSNKIEIFNNVDNCKSTITTIIRRQFRQFLSNNYNVRRSRSFDQREIRTIINNISLASTPASDKRLNIFNNVDNCKSTITTIIRRQFRQFFIQQPQRTAKQIVRPTGDKNSEDTFTTINQYKLSKYLAVSKKSSIFVPSNSKVQLYICLNNE